MKYNVRIDGRTFEAEVGNVDARPIVVMVEGERFEVWPEARPTAECAEEKAETPEPESEGSWAARSGRGPSGAGAAPTAGKAGVERLGLAAAKVRAPIPGVIDSVAVRPGDAVGAGDPLCVIEAMKMKNVVRASRSGAVEDVLVAPGQHVHHNDVLLEFSE
jgi:biotin carboxyl carrier protein